MKPCFETVPPIVVTVILPEVPFATTACRLFGDITLNEVAAVIPKLTDRVLLKLLPIIVTVSPSEADKGRKELIKGLGDRKSVV